MTCLLFLLVIGVIGLFIYGFFCVGNYYSVLPRLGAVCTMLDNKNENLKLFFAQGLNIS